MSPQQSFGANLRRHRSRQGLSQEQLAQRCGIHLSEISRLERTERDPRLSTIVKVARGLGITASELLKGID